MNLLGTQIILHNLFFSREILKKSEKKIYEESKVSFVSL